MGQVSDLGCAGRGAGTCLRIVLTPLRATFRSVYGRVGSSGRFNILASSISSCGLDKELMGEGPFTIFAPGETASGPWLLFARADSYSCCMPPLGAHRARRFYSSTRSAPLHSESDSFLPMPTGHARR